MSLDKNNKLNWSSYSKEYKKLGEIINTEEQINEFRMIQNEFANEIIYRILESLDGYGSLEFEVGLIDKETKEIISKETQLHDRFATKISCGDKFR